MTLNAFWIELIELIQILKLNSITLNEFELNSNSTKLNQQLNKDSIKLKKNEMQIGGENIENMFVNMMLEKKPLKRHKSKNTSLDAYLFRNGL